ncbi:uncharacterized protein LOC109504175 [Harpegnathos saltator]|uniref:uncharacterized protein LOC109504175 n=1 Tax=Harpegnathos saltator TaxID=610380 RepID=UPI000DBEE445|nr:uncharacterized protein LOC109504175 [Harpegnathos saltator]
MGTGIDSLPAEHFESVEGRRGAGGLDDEEDEEDQDDHARQRDCLTVGAFISPYDEYIDCRKFCKVSDGVDYRYYDRVGLILNDRRSRPGAYCMPNDAAVCNTNHLSPFIASMAGDFFSQAVLRKWRKQRPSNVPKTVLSMTMTLPLLLPEMFQEALHIIQTEAGKLSNEYPDILQFMSYLRLNWSKMVSRISTYCCPVRTNNIVESFHNIATQKLGTMNINIWVFLEKLSHLIPDQELDLRRLENGIKPRRPRTGANRENDSKMRHAQEDLVNERLSLKEFLLMFTMHNNFEIEKMASFEDAELTCDLEITSDENANMELFSEDIGDFLQTGFLKFIFR